MDWISVEDRLPESGVYVLAIDAVDNDYEVTSFDGKGFWPWKGSATGHNPYITHWMPLPEPPNGDH